MKLHKNGKVITCSGSDGTTLRLCPRCDTLPALRDSRGQEYCQVSRGLSHGYCEHPEHGRLATAGKAVAL